MTSVIFLHFNMQEEGIQQQYVSRVYKYHAK